MLEGILPGFMTRRLAVARDSNGIIRSKNEDEDEDEDEDGVVLSQRHARPFDLASLPRSHRSEGFEMAVRTATEEI